MSSGLPARKEANSTLGLEKPLWRLQRGDTLYSLNLGGNENFQAHNFQKGIGSLVQKPWPTPSLTGFSVATESSLSQSLPCDSEYVCPHSSAAGDDCHWAP